MSDKSDTIITISISPLAGGKRKVLISGAPEHEMPTVRTGTFSDLHRLVDEVWVELQKRKPQIVQVKIEKKKAKSEPTSVKPGDQLVAAEEQDEAPDPVEKDLDDAGANATPEAPEELPEIEGDTPETETEESDE